MRVVHFLQGRANPNGINGGDRVIYNLAKCTAEQGAEVYVFGLSEKPPLAAGRAVVQSFHLPRDPFSLPSALIGKLREIKPRIVHFHGVYTLRNAFLAQWLRRQCIPYAISPHGGLMKEVLSRGRMTKLTYLSLVGREFCRGASLIHCISEAEANDVRPFCGEARTVIAPHGLEGTDPQRLDHDALRKELPNLQGKRIFGFLGRLDPAHKGLDLLVAACDLARAHLRNAVVILAGPDWRNRTLALRKKVAELGLQDTVLFLGPKMERDKFNFLICCDVFVHPSRWEAGLPFSVLDALELGKPCLVSNGSFFGSFFQEHAAGAQVPPTSEGIAQGLRHLASATSAELETMGATGRKAALHEFSWERTVRTLLQAYDSAQTGRVTALAANASV